MAAPVPIVAGIPRRESATSDDEKYIEGQSIEIASNNSEQDLINK